MSLFPDPALHVSHLLFPNRSLLYLLAGFSLFFLFFIVYTITYFPICTHLFWSVSLCGMWSLQRAGTLSPLITTVGLAPTIMSEIEWALEVLFSETCSIFCLLFLAIIITHSQNISLASNIQYLLPQSGVYWGLDVRLCWSGLGLLTHLKVVG